LVGLSRSAILLAFSGGGEPAADISEASEAMVLDIQNVLVEKMYSFPGEGRKCETSRRTMSLTCGYGGRVLSLPVECMLERFGSAAVY
jgi:hypothetical protein